VVSERWSKQEPRHKDPPPGKWTWDLHEALSTELCSNNHLTYGWNAMISWICFQKGKMNKHKEWWAISCSLFNLVDSTSIWGFIIPSYLF
jgi:hypothetical protein